jgi:hypothetical protein
MVVRRSFVWEEDLILACTYLVDGFEVQSYACTVLAGDRLPSDLHEVFDYQSALHKVLPEGKSAFTLEDGDGFSSEAARSKRRGVRAVGRNEWRVGRSDE